MRNSETMQEAPNFNTYLSRYKNSDRGTVLDSREVISGPDRAVFESVYDRLDLYFNDTDFRSQIPIQTRSTIEDGYITNILSYLETIASWQRDGGTVIAGGNLQGQIQNISGQLVGLDQHMAGFYFTHFRKTEPTAERLRIIESLVTTAEQESRGLHEVIESAKAQVAEKTSGFDSSLNTLEGEAKESLQGQMGKGSDLLANIEKILKNAKLLIGRASGHQLGDYYHKLANGRTIAENDDFTRNRGKAFEKFQEKLTAVDWEAYLVFSLATIYAAILIWINNPIVVSDWMFIGSIIIWVGIIIITTAYLLMRGVALFNTRFKGGHERTAVLWMIGAISSTIITAIYAAVLIRELSFNGDITWETIIPKIIVLLAPAYLVRLCVQNYRANAHLTVQYLHRATIMSIAENYSNMTSTDASQTENLKLNRISHEAKMLILTDAAKIMFAQSESGYITQKEGAGGNGDNMIDALNRNARS